MKIRNIVILFLIVTHINSYCITANVPLGIYFLNGNSETNPITIYTIGDSTMTDYSNFPKKFPMFGWGQVLGKYFNSEQVIVVDKARSGRSAKTFISEGLWDEVLQLLKAGDYVFIQFGHNDEKDSDLIEYKANLLKFVNETIAKEAIPVLITPTTRRTFDSSGVLYDSHVTGVGDFPATVRILAQENNIDLIDMTKSSMDLVQSLGVEGSKKIYLYLEPGIYSNYPDGSADNTHFSEYGANKMAKLAVEGLRELESPLVSMLKDFTSVKCQSAENVSMYMFENKLYFPKPIPANLSIYNLGGIMVKNIWLNKSTSIFDISDLKNGVYILNLKTDMKMITGKAVKMD